MNVNENYTNIFSINIEYNTNNNIYSIFFNYTRIYFFNIKYYNILVCLYYYNIYYIYKYL